MKPHRRWVSTAIKSRHAVLNRLHCIELLFLWCISDRPQCNAQNPEGLCTTQRQPAQGRPDRCAAAMPSCVYLWAVEFVIPLCNAMTGKYENDLLWSTAVFVNMLNIMFLGCLNGILLLQLPTQAVGNGNGAVPCYTLNPEENTFQMSGNMRR